MSEPSRLKILLAEDHELTRIGLSHSLMKAKTLEVVGEAEDGREALALSQETRPDVILMDIGMPVMDGITATQHIKRTQPQIKVVILTSHKNQQEVLAAMTAGADAYCSKEIKAERLLQVLEMVMDGVLWLDPSIAKTIQTALMQSGAPRLGTLLHTDADMHLTDRENEVLAHIVNGLANKEISEAMNLSIYTIKGHVASLIQKLSVSDRTQAAVKALKLGLVKY